MQAQFNGASIYRKGCFHGSDDKYRCAVWLAYVRDRGIVEIYTAFRHKWGNPASGSPVAGSYLTHNESGSLRFVSRI
jgi:hypothetical protein